METDADTDTDVDLYTDMVMDINSEFRDVYWYYSSPT